MFRITIKWWCYVCVLKVCIIFVPVKDLITMYGKSIISRIPLTGNVFALSGAIDGSSTVGLLLFTCIRSFLSCSNICQLQIESIRWKKTTCVLFSLIFLGFLGRSLLHPVALAYTAFRYWGYAKGLHGSTCRAEPWLYSGTWQFLGGEGNARDTREHLEFRVWGSHWKQAHRKGILNIGPPLITQYVARHFSFATKSLELSHHFLYFQEIQCQQVAKILAQDFRKEVPLSFGETPR